MDQETRVYRRFCYPRCAPNLKTSRPLLSTANWRTTLPSVYYSYETACKYIQLSIDMCWWGSRNCNSFCTHRRGCYCSSGCYCRWSSCSCEDPDTLRYSKNSHFSRCCCIPLHYCTSHSDYGSLHPPFFCSWSDSVVPRNFPYRVVSGTFHVHNSTSFLFVVYHETDAENQYEWPSVRLTRVENTN